MYRLEITKAEYEVFKERLQELHPEIRVHLSSCDEALKKLGFVESAPCIVFLDMNNVQMESLLHELDQFEVNLYNVNECSEDVQAENEYERYECLNKWLYSATVLKDVSASGLVGKAQTEE